MNPNENQPQNPETKSEKYNIERFRKKKKRRKIIRRILFSFFILCIGIGIFFIVEAISQNNSAHASDESQFPVNLKGVEAISLQATNRSLTVLGESNLYFYAADAEREFSVKHGFSNPVLEIGDNKAVTYDQGGHNIRIDTRSGELKEIETESQILFCKISSDGYLAVVTFEDRFNSSITIYNQDYEQIYRYKESNYYITGFDFINGQKGVLMTQTVSNGDFCTVVYGLDFHKSTETEFFTTELNGVVGYSVNAKQNGNIFITGNTGITVLNEKGDIESSYIYANEMRFLWDKENATILSLKNMLDPNETDIILMNDDGTVKVQTKITGTLLDLYCLNDKIVLLDKNNIYEYNFQLELVNTYPNQDNFYKIILFQNQIYGLSSESLNVVS